MARNNDKRDQCKRAMSLNWLKSLLASTALLKLSKVVVVLVLLLLMVVGDGKGRVGFGTGKAKEVPEAIRKATDNAKRNMVRVPLRDGRTLHHDIKGFYGAGHVILRTAPAGTGIIAGGPMRAVFEALGVQDVVSKSIGTSNPHNMIKATFSALNTMQAPRAVAAKRGKRVNEVLW